MQIDKIAVLMAVYEPNISWLYEQLCSINRQTYPNISLYLCDDGSDDEVYESIKQCVTKCITNFHVTLIRNEKNMGSNATFERLTNIAEGDYFAYSDQDDIWEDEKLSALYQYLISEKAVMSYSDMSVIDENGKKTAESLTEIRPRLEYLSGKSLSEKYFFRNCTAGCSMLIKSNIAKLAIPFPKSTVCDQWLAILASCNGKIVFVNKSLIRYRQHGNNQTGILYGVNDKKSYMEKRLIPLIERMEYLKKYYRIPDEMKSFIDARLNGKIFGIFRGRAYSPYDAKFEIVIRILPSFIVSRLLDKIKNRSNR